MLRAHFRPVSVAVLAVLAAAVAGIAGCGTAGHGSAGGVAPPRASTAGSTNSRAARTLGTARYQRTMSALAPRPAALPAAVRDRGYCVGGEIPVPFRHRWPGNCGGVMCPYATPAGVRPGRPGAGPRPQPVPPVPVLLCGWPVCCFCPPHWPLNGLNGNEALPRSRLLPADIPPACPEPQWGERGDSNPRHPGPQPGALTN